MVVWLSIKEVKPYFVKIWNDFDRCFVLAFDLRTRSIWALRNPIMNGAIGLGRYDVPE